MALHQETPYGPYLPPQLRATVLGPLTEGRTFAEVGGLWGTVNEACSIALRSGAREVTMIDITLPGTPLWKRFEERCPAATCVVGDICDHTLAERVGRFDIVYCGGVLYHVPSPINAIHNLLSITSERLMISCAVVPNVISNSVGELRIHPGEYLFIPTLGAKRLAIVQEYFRSERRLDTVGGITRPGRFVKDGHVNYAPWWYLFTAGTLTDMCRLFDADVEKVWAHAERSASVLLRVRDQARRR